MAKLTELDSATDLDGADLLALTQVADTVSRKTRIADVLQAFPLVSVLAGIAGDAHDSGSVAGYLEVAAGALPATITWWDSSSKSRKLLEATITYTGDLPTTVVWQYYDGAGLPTTSYTETRTYIGGRLSTLDRIVTP